MQTEPQKLFHQTRLLHLFRTLQADQKQTQQAALFCTNYRNWSWILWNLKPERASVASILTVNVTQALKPYPDIAALTPKTTVQIKHFNSQKPNAVSAAGKNVSNLQCPLKGKTCIWWHTQIPPCRWQHYLVEVPLKSDSWGKSFPKRKSGFHLDPDTQRNSSHSWNKKDLLHHHRALFHLLWSHLLLASVDSEGSHLNPKTHLTSDSLRKSFSCTAGHQQIPGTSRHDHPRVARQSSVQRRQFCSPLPRACERCREASWSTANCRVRAKHHEHPRWSQTKLHV